MAQANKTAFLDFGKLIGEFTKQIEDTTQHHVAKCHLSASGDICIDFFDKKTYQFVTVFDKNNKTPEPETPETPETSTPEPSPPPTPETPETFTEEIPVTIPAEIQEEILEAQRKERKRNK